MNQMAVGIRAMMEKMGKSERDFSSGCGVARTTLRKLLQGDLTAFAPLVKIVQKMGHTLSIVSYPSEHFPLNSTIAISYRILRDGEPSWKIHVMDLVDEFRSTLDMRLVLLPPERLSSPRIQTLISAAVIQLCKENFLNAPTWALNTPPLLEPWFVSEMESLKASAILESPQSFRQKNIFVLDNFLERM